MAVVAGSSPRGRGKPWGVPFGVVFYRLIPAWAGKTAGVLARAVSVGGSSPRGRGKRKRLHRCLACSGLIPAWAGKTFPDYSEGHLRRAHPRVGGENVISPFAIASRKGSSPRGRGKRLFRILVSRARRLIPAWAGKTSFITIDTGMPWAHPRVGGENREGKVRSRVYIGSSPRGRGKPRGGGKNA